MYKKILLISFIALASCKSNKQDDKSKLPTAAAPPNVDVVIATAKSISNTIEANGSVVPNEIVEIHPEISGRLTLLNIAEGTTVAAGTVLAKINDADLQAQLGKSKVQLDLANRREIQEITFCEWY